MESDVGLVCKCLVFGPQRYLFYVYRVLFTIMCSNLV